jgi:hypothetical protein
MWQSLVPSVGNKRQFFSRVWGVRILYHSCHIGIWHDFHPLHCDYRLIGHSISVLVLKCSKATSEPPGDVLQVLLMCAVIIGEQVCSSDNASWVVLEGGSSMNLGRGTDNGDVFCVLHDSSLPGKFLNVTLIRPWSLVFVSFQIHYHHPIILRYIDCVTDRVEK